MNNRNKHNFDDFVDESLFDLGERPSSESEKDEDASIVDELIRESECDGEDDDEYTGKVYGEEEYNAVCQERDDFKNKYLYAAAEIENLKKRQATALSDSRWNSSAAVMRAILNIVDDFELSINYNQKFADEYSENSIFETIADGYKIIYKKLSDALESLGCRKMSLRPGNDQYVAFDTDYHEAVGTFQTKNAKLDKMIVEVQQNGYIYQDKVLRFAKVIVGKFVK